MMSEAERSRQDAGATLGVVGGGSGFETVGFVAGGDGAVASADYGEAFGVAESWAAPPIAADGAAGDVLGAAQCDDFVDVKMALQNCHDVVSFESR
jgi:hypothetical protein